MRSPTSSSASLARRPQPARPRRRPRAGRVAGPALASPAGPSGPPAPSAAVSAPRHRRSAMRRPRPRPSATPRRTRPRPSATDAPRRSTPRDRGQGDRVHAQDADDARRPPARRPPARRPRARRRRARRPRAGGIGAGRLNLGSTTATRRDADGGGQADRDPQADDAQDHHDPQADHAQDHDAPQADDPAPAPAGGRLGRINRLDRGVTERPAVGAAVDLGSNSVHLLVAAIAGHTPGRSSMSLAFLAGAAVDGAAHLGEATTARLLETLAAYAATARSLGARHITLLGTEPLRRAADAARVVAFVEERTGAPLHVLTHEEEAYLDPRGRDRWPPGHARDARPGHRRRQLGVRGRRATAARPRRSGCGSVATA